MEPQARPNPADADVSSRHRANGEAESDDLRRQLARAEERIAGLEATLDRQARARADLVHLVSHELRTPITVISGFSRLLTAEGEQELSERQNHFVEESLRACRRLDRFVGDLLEACPDSGTPLAVEPAEAVLDDMIRTLVTSFEPVLSENEVDLDLRLDSGRTLRCFDARRLEQVVTNLLTNAMRYGSEKARIRLSTRALSAAEAAAVVEAGSACEICIEDDGPGIPEADRKRIFLPYVRGVESDAPMGLGIGLAICQRIVDSHGGQCRVETSELGGARFVITIPDRAEHASPPSIPNWKG